MNATEKIFALALASNLSPEKHFSKAYDKLRLMGDAVFSNIYLIPCRDGVGADYWNSACLLKSTKTVQDMLTSVKELETEMGRVRPSHKISLDIDVIAWGNDLSHMQFNEKKLPLAVDVKIPLFELWQSDSLKTSYIYFSKVTFPKAV